MIIRRAIPDDTPTVHAILHHAAKWLHERGYDQWPDNSPSLGYERLLAQIGRGETYLISDGTDPVGTIALTSKGDSDFWTPTELAEPAIYVSKAAVVRSWAGNGLGALVLRWVIDYAARQGAVWTRLDAWRTNQELHTYYRSQGWTDLRTVQLRHRRSGALFQKRAALDPEARAAFIWRELLVTLPRLPLALGSRVITNTPDGPVAATIAAINGPDWGYGEIEQGWEQGTSSPSVEYVVTREGRSWIPLPGQLWPDPSVEVEAIAAELSNIPEH